MLDEHNLLDESGNMEGPLRFMPSMAALTKRLEGPHEEIEMVEVSTRGLATEAATHVLTWMWSRHPGLSLNTEMHGAPKGQAEVARALSPASLPSLLSTQPCLCQVGTHEEEAAKGQPPFSSSEAPDEEEDASGRSPMSGLGHFFFAC